MHVSCLWLFRQQVRLKLGEILRLFWWGVNPQQCWLEPDNSSACSTDYPAPDQLKLLLTSSKNVENQICIIVKSKIDTWSLAHAFVDFSLMYPPRRFMIAGRLASASLDFSGFSSVAVSDEKKVSDWTQLPICTTHQFCWWPTHEPIELARPSSLLHLNDKFGMSSGFHDLVVDIYPSSCQ